MTATGCMRILTISISCTLLVFFVICTTKSQSTQLAVIMLIDIVGYTAFMGEEEGVESNLLISSILEQHEL